MDASGNIIPIVEDDQGEGFMDEVGETSQGNPSGKEPKKRPRSGYAPGKLYVDHSGKTRYRADPSGALRRLGKERLTKAEKKARKKARIASRTNQARRTHEQAESRV